MVVHDSDVHSMSLDRKIIFSNRKQVKKLVTIRLLDNQNPRPALPAFPETKKDDMLLLDCADRATTCMHGSLSPPLPPN